MQDFRYALRQLWRSPEWSMVALATLAVGIGSCVVAYSIGRAALVEATPFREADRIVQLWQHYPDAGHYYASVGAAESLDYRSRARSFAVVADYRVFYFDSTSIDGPPETVAALRASSALFAILEARPAVGRFFTEGEHHVAVLSHGYWERRYGRDPSVIGRSLELDTRVYTVIGVLPKGLTFPSTALSIASDPPDLWIPLVFSNAELENRSGHYSGSVVTRLREGVTLTDASADVARVASDVTREYPQFYGGTGRLHASVEPWGAEDRRRVRPMVALLIGTVAVVLLIACANVMNLLLARTGAREREMAIRSALGASAGRLARQTVVESLVLTSAAGAVGAAMALGAMGWVRSVDTEQVSLRHVTLDWHALAFAVLLSIAVGLVCGSAPAWLRFRGPVRFSRGRLRDSLVMVQAAAALVLLTLSGLLAESLLRVLNTPLGFDPDNAIIMRARFGRIRYPESPERHRAQRAIAERLAALAGVTAVGLTTNFPLTYPKPAGYYIEGEDAHAGRTAVAELVDAGYFAAMGIPVLQGRVCGSDERSGTPASVLVNRSLAEKHWPNGGAIGRRIFWGPRRLTVFGVVGDVRETALESEPEPAIYPCLYQTESLATVNGIFVIRGPAVASLADAARRAMWSVDPALVVNQVAPLRDLVKQSVSTRRLMVAVLGTFAAVALMLAMIGLYGVLSYAVVRRTQEIGVRVALGSTRTGVVGLFVREGVVLTAKGLAVGAFASIAAAQAASPFLYGVSPTDPVSLSVASAVMLVTAAAAAYLPARRASLVDPMIALRRE
jgi:putative ABC transport system permease protein